MDLAAGWLCVVYLWVTQYAFSRKDFKVAAATSLDLTIKRIVPDRDVMN